MYNFCFVVVEIVTESISNRFTKNYINFDIFFVALKCTLYGFVTVIIIKKKRNIEWTNRVRGHLPQKHRNAFNSFDSVHFFSFSTLHLFVNFKPISNKRDDDDKKKIASILKTKCVSLVVWNDKPNVERYLYYFVSLLM